MRFGDSRRPSRRKLFLEALENRRVMATLQGNIFLDSDIDRTRDAGENLLAGSAMTFYVDLDASGTRTLGDIVGTTNTGQYTLVSPVLGAGTFRVLLDTAGTSFLQSGPGPLVTILDPLVVATVPDIGVYRTGEIRGQKFNDHNSDGIKQATDEGVPGVGFSLANVGADGVVGGGDDGPTVNVVTDASGNYVFPNLAVGNYQLAEAADPNVKTTTAAFTIFTVNASGQVFVAAPEVLSDPFQSLQVIRPELRRGNFRLGEIYGYSFVDVNGNGVDNSEPTVTPGVTITLRGAGADNAFGTADDLPAVVKTPDAVTGRFDFKNLDFGRYQVSAALPAAVTRTTSPLGVFSINDSGLIYAPTATLVTAGPRQLAPVVRPELAIGLFRGAEIRGQKFNDHNADGVKQATDEGVAGVRFTLTNLATSVATVIASDSNGDFAFTNLAIGTYRLAEEANADIKTTTAAFTDFVVNASGQLFVAVAATPDAYQTVVLRPELRRGNFRLGEIYGYVFTDRNSNGVDNAETRGMPGVSVLLTWAGPDNDFATAADNTTQTLTPDATTGLFSATRLEFGRYRLQEQLPTDVVRTTNALGTYSINDSGVLIAATSTLVTSGPRQKPIDVKTELAIGAFRLGEIHGYVFVDANDNTVDNSESRATQGVSVTLEWAGPDGNFATAGDNTTTTLAVNATTGRFSATQLRFGLYRLTEVLPSKVVRTTNPLGTYNVNDSGLEFSATSTLVLADVRQTLVVRPELALGIFRLGVIRGYAFLDKFGDGLDAGTDPRDTTGQVKVQLFKDGAAVGVEQTVNAAGDYRFEDLRGGNYRIEVSAIGADRKLTTARVTNNLVIVSGRVWEARANLESPLDFYQASQVNSGLAVGTAKKAVIKGIVYLDRDGNGTRGAADQEPGMANFTVSLIGAGLDNAFGTADDLTFPSILTTATGIYEFQVDARNPNGALTASPDIVPGNFRITIAEPAHYTRAGVPETRNITGVRLNDVLLGTGLTPTVALDGGQTQIAAPALNFGVQRFAAIYGVAFNDLNANGSKDAGEPIISGQKFNIQGTTKEAISNAEGVFVFEDLVAGSYTVRPVINTDSATGQEVQGRTKDYAVVAASLNNIYVARGLDPRLPFEKAESSTPAVERIILNKSRETQLEQGLVQLSKLQGSIFVDANANGKKDATEAGQAGVKVSIRRVVKDYQQDELPTQRSTTTNAQGTYTFFVWPGTYDVAEVKLDSFEPIATLPTTVASLPGYLTDDASRQRFTDYGLINPNSGIVPIDPVKQVEVPVKVARPRWTTAAALDADGIDNDLVVVYEYLNLSNLAEGGGVVIYKNIGTANATTVTVPLGDTRPAFATVLQLDTDQPPEIVVALSGKPDTSNVNARNAWGNVVVLNSTGATSYAVLDARTGLAGTNAGAKDYAAALAGNGPKHISSKVIDGLQYLSVVNERTFDSIAAPTQDVSILRQSAANSLTFVKVATLNISTQFVAANVVSTAFGNFDGVGQPEIAVAESTLGRVEFFDVAGNKKMTALTGLTAPTHVLAGNFVDIGAAVGLEDLVVSEYGNGTSGGQVRLYPQVSGALPASSQIIVGSVNKAGYMAAADINGDNLLDLAVASQDSGQVQFFYNRLPGLPSAGQPKFQATNPVATWDRVPQVDGTLFQRQLAIQQVAFGNFNGDNAKDFVAAPFTGAISIHTSAVTTAKNWRDQTSVTQLTNGIALTDKRTLPEDALIDATTVFPLTKAIKNANVSYDMKKQLKNTGAIAVPASFAFATAATTSVVIAAGNVRTTPAPLALSAALLPSEKAMDVSGNGHVEPLDALLVINSLNNLASGEQAAVEFDVNGDGILSPMDALLIINELNSSGAIGETIDASTAESMVQAALERLDAAPAIQSAIQSALGGFNVLIDDLPAGVLSWVDGNNLVVDRDAAGRGWFVDSTPTDDAEFVTGDSVIGVDLLSVVTHELGHLLGLEDLSESGEDEIMHATLRSGERRLNASAVDRLLAQI